mmetsp:Transcript_42453/g.107147  ORF Transcript_42453/g.107147 Transcript_42453/m.107147 type:complete len:95 (-) Transcript_42453:52-336(-)
MRLLAAHQERDIEVQRRIMLASAVSMPGLSPLHSPIIRDPAPFPALQGVSPQKQAETLLRALDDVERDLKELETRANVFTKLVDLDTSLLDDPT